LEDGDDGGIEAVKEGRSVDGESDESPLKGSVGNFWFWCW